MAKLTTTGILEALPGGFLPQKSAPGKLNKNSRDGLRNVLNKQFLTAGEMPEEVAAAATISGRVSNSLQKSMTKLLDGPDGSIERLAFERDPQRIAEFAGIWRPKLQLIPDNLLKRMAIQDDLVAAVVHTRCNHTSQFGRKQQDRHTKGFKFVIDPTLEEKLSKEQKEKLQERIDRAENLLLSCGHTKGWSQQDRCSFTEYLYMSTRNAIVLGRMATEVVYVPDPKDPHKRVFHSFRPTDAGTIYYAAPYKEANESIREQAKKLLEQMKNEKLQQEKFENEEYDWVQVIDGRPLQAFGSDEMLVQNFYPVTDIELQGYPLTPLDTAIAAVTTHINITNHNKLYFQYGRAARGMLVIKSQDVDAEVVQAVKQQFNASINAVHNSWRMPVFGIGPEDDLQWVPIDQGSRDMEFQYLSDSNARTIMAAFQMSPEELPGYQHLSRGTNNQALSESSNEWKLTAARDVGIRPLIAKLEDFLNDSLMPLIDPDLAKYVKLRLIGLDIEDEEKESVRLQQDMGVHMTYDEVLQKVEKKPIGKKAGGKLPLNQQVMALIEKYLTFGQILEEFCGVEGASQKPEFQFYQNEAWMKWKEMQAQEQQMQAQAQQQAQQPQGGPPGGGGPGGPPPGGGGAPAPAQGGQDGGGELGSAVDQLGQLLGKSQSDRQRLKAHQKSVNDRIMEAFRAESLKLVEGLADIADIHKPRKA